MSGIADVARRAGVSKSTASRALSGRGYVSPATQRRVQAAADALGYVPSTSAVSLATGRTQTVGVIVPHTTNWYFGEVLAGVQHALMERDLDLALYSGHPGTLERARVFETYLGRSRFDGLITVGIEPDQQELERIAALGKPFVSIGSYDVGNSAVSIDDEATARLATEHLLALGHTDIVFLGGEVGGTWPSFGDARRFHGYAEAMRSAGWDSAIRRISSEVSMPGGYDAAVDLLSDARRRPTGIVAVADEVGIGAIIAARRMGVGVPSQVSVVGIDDHANAAMFALTTLRQSPREQARLAVELLQRHLEDAAATPKRVWAPTRFIIRNSTSAPPASA
ncbi:LacI family DNA-binding transcriptional regulator [Microbacterium gorillae]|uniref:LacI family DNA-binding transcriptional regulator n=1 Tax=Microbacterium gorillae TaxID=1231063 RepID=UPI00058D088A|nr:LacI family DNA-binding transcriptional regulator [Microbacterium gorillae]